MDGKASAALAFLNRKQLGRSQITILQLCTLLGVYIPRFCYHEKLSIVGSCRMCLVEICKASKPMVACSTPLLTGMDIYTETALIKNAREHVLEFLLINHPLDCPICDQGGECDLQDQSLLYGSDLGRFKDSKRAVLEKNLGPFIKTVMTRCIHCTRCVRFMSEIAGSNLLGILGKGKDMEIGTYINAPLLSEISGNIIDICPVGALTSKPFAFTNRSWELRSVESIDILDGLGSSIRIDLRGAELVRVLPKTNEYLNEQWITNKIRFTYDGFRYRRLSVPFIHVENWSYQKASSFLYINASWEFVCKLVMCSLVYLLIHSADVGFMLGDFVDLNTVLFIDRVSDVLGSFIQSNLDSANFTIDFPDDYLLNKPIPHFEKSNLYVFIGCDVCFESPLLNARISKKITHEMYSKKTIVSFGSLSVRKNNYMQLGINAHGLIKLIQGRHFFCDKMNHFNDITWITNYHYSGIHSDIFNILSLFSRFAGKKNLVNVLHKDCSIVSKLNVGCFDHGYKGLTKYSTRKVQCLYNIGSDEVIQEKCGNYYLVYQGHHNFLSLRQQKAFILLPSSTFVEQTSIYMNTEGRFLFSRKAVTPPGLAKNDFEIFKIISTMLLIFLYKKRIRNNTIRGKIKFKKKTETIFILIPQLLYYQKWRKLILGVTVWRLYYSYFIQVTHSILAKIVRLTNIVYHRLIDNYYNTSVINSASKILSKFNVKLSNYGMNY